MEWLSVMIYLSKMVHNIIATLGYQRARWYTELFGKAMERERERIKNMFKAIVMVGPAMCAHDKMMSTYVYFSWTCSIYINFIEGDIGVEDLTPQKNRTVNAY